jgi:hypothetical protein
MRRPAIGWSAWLGLFNGILKLFERLSIQPEPYDVLAFRITTGNLNVLDV